MKKNIRPNNKGIEYIKLTTKTFHDFLNINLICGNTTEDPSFGQRIKVINIGKNNNPPNSSNKKTIELRW